MNDRHAFRARWHDYNGGIYFVTICTHRRKHLFGRIHTGAAVGTRFIASALGEIAEEAIINIPTHYTDVQVWNHVVMPNHIHMVLSIVTSTVESDVSIDTDKPFGCLKPPMHTEGVADFHHNSRLATIVGAFKAGVTRNARTRLIASLPGLHNYEHLNRMPIWQSRYHEHIIRNQRAYDNIMNYIDNNIRNWHKDCFCKDDTE